MRAVQNVADHLRAMCRDLSRGKVFDDVDVSSKLEELGDDPDWRRIRLAMGLMARSVISHTYGDPPEYSTVAAFVASIHPAVNRLFDYSLTELQYWINELLEIDSERPGSLVVDSEEEFDRQYAIVLCVVFFCCMDVADEDVWSGFERILDTVEWIDEEDLD